MYDPNRVDSDKAPFGKWTNDHSENSGKKAPDEDPNYNSQ
jgi:hypothetical protein